MKKLSIRLFSVGMAITVAAWAGTSSASVLGGTDANSGVVRIFADYNFCALMDLKGKVIDTSKYDEVGFASEGLVSVKKDELWGFIDTKGREVVKPSFQYVYFYQEGFAAVQTKSGKWGFIDKTGNMVIKPQYSAVESFSEGLAAVKTDRKFGFIDTSGALVIPEQYSRAHEFKEGLGRVSADNQDEMGFIDRSGNFVIQPQPYTAQAFREGLALVEVKGQGGGFIDKTGRVVVQPQYQLTGQFYDGLAKVTKNGRAGYIDHSFAEVIPLQFEEARDFSEGYAPAKMNGKWGVIDKTGEFVITPQYENVSSFTHGVAQVQSKGSVGYATTELKWAISPDQMQEKAKPCIARVEKIKAEQIAKRDAEAKAILENWRRKLSEGELTNCGPVIEVKKKLVKVSFPVANYGNEHWIRRDQIMPSVYSCEFVNGHYQAPRN